MPNYVHEVRNLLGYFSYYGQFIPYLSEMKKKTGIANREGPFQWNDEQEKAFDDLKDMMSRGAILVHPQSKGEFVLHDRCQ